MDGWFEWTGEKERKLPWYIRLKSDRSMFAAAISDWRPFTMVSPESGFVIVTAAAEGGWSMCTTAGMWCLGRKTGPLAFIID